MNSRKKSYTTRKKKFLDAAAFSCYLSWLWATLTCLAGCRDALAIA